MMAVECIKLISGAGAVLRGEMLIYDALWSETRKITLKRREDCPVCGGAAGGTPPYADCVAVTSRETVVVIEAGGAGA